MQILKAGPSITSKNPPKCLLRETYKELTYMVGKEGETALEVAIASIAPPRNQLQQILAVLALPGKARDLTGRTSGF